MTRLLPLFVYGTLSDKTILKALINRELPMIKACLRGFRKLDPPYSFPLIVPDPRFEVEGFLLLDLEPEMLQIIDEYEDEGKLYRRVLVKVETDDGFVEAYTYIGDPGFLLRGRDLKSVWEE